MQRSGEETIVYDQLHAGLLHVVTEALHFLTNLFCRLNAVELRGGYQPLRYWPCVEGGAQ